MSHDCIVLWNSWLTLLVSRCNLDLILIFWQHLDNINNRKKATSSFENDIFDGCNTVCMLENTVYMTL